MKPITTEWVQKAEEDFATLELLWRQPRLVAPDVVCFHAQQCVEKYLKARLQEAGLEFPKTHDLDKLLNLARVVEPLWDSWRARLSLLTDYAVESRYPGDTAGKEEVRRAVATCREFRLAARRTFGLEPPERGQTELRVREKKARYHTRRSQSKRKP
jgi:HEPN domain-containing protein